MNLMLEAPVLSELLHRASEWSPKVIPSLVVFWFGLLFVAQRREGRCGWPLVALVYAICIAAVMVGVVIITPYRYFKTGR